MIRTISHEIRAHAPFTAMGALVGIIIILAFDFGGISNDTAEPLFETFHPAHVVLSAIVTTAIYTKFSRASLWSTILVGYAGSVGIATISDSLIPYLGEYILDLNHPEAHIGFIELWWLVNPLAFAGIAIGYYKPTTKLPHMGHVLLSMAASLFHIMMALGESFDLILIFPIFLFLTLAVLLPCCASDIAFPLLFVKGKASGHQHARIKCSCADRAEPAN